MTLLRAHLVKNPVGVPRIELGLSAPKADVLPIYYTPDRNFDCKHNVSLRPRVCGQAVKPAVRLCPRHESADSEFANSETVTECYHKRLFLQNYLIPQFVYRIRLSMNLTFACLVFISRRTVIASNCHSGSPFGNFSRRYAWIVRASRLSFCGWILSSGR